MIVSNPMALAIAEWLTIERRGIEHRLTGNVYGTRKSGRPAPSLAGQAHAGRGGRSVQEFDRPSFRLFLTLTDLHPHTLTFRQPAQSAAPKRRGMDEDILPTAIPPYEPKPFIGVVPFNRTDAFLGGPNADLSLRKGTRGRAPLRRARDLSMCLCPPQSLQ